MTNLGIAVHGIDLDFSHLSTIFAGEAQMCYRKGDEKRIAFGGSAQHEQDGWLLQTVYPEDVEVGEAVAEFIGTHLQRAEEIRTLAEGCDVTLTLALYPDEESGELVLQPEVISAIAGCGVQLVITYNFFGAADDL
ncbi:MAG: hypothetical protein ABT01_05800 [Clostridium sp. SCN 57-10]|nr:MAG: hypothetical protein ABT01_05800 [Clostridium sp. SCN 57-10]